MTNNDKEPDKGQESPEVSWNQGREYRPKGFLKGIYLTFFWCMVGVSVIYGIRLWFDVPPHPTFMPIIGAVFAAVLSFTLVIALEYVIGPIQLKVGDKFNFTGASGPIILWCICFTVVIFGLYMLGIGDIVTNEYPDTHSACSVLDLTFNNCPPTAH